MRLFIWSPERVQTNFFPQLFDRLDPHACCGKPYRAAGLSTRIRLRRASSGAHSVSKSKITAPMLPSQRDWGDWLGRDRIRFGHAGSTGKPRLSYNDYPRRKALRKSPRYVFPHQRSAVCGAGSGTFGQSDDQNG